MQLLASFALAWAINALALWIADGLFDGVSIEGWAAYVIGASVLAIANAIVKPILTILTLPLIVFTFGFFLLVINIAMVALAEWIAPDFSIDGFWTYVGVVVIVWVVNWASYAFIERSLRSVRRQS
ncbi:MAG TPA: phage holin family protein [Gaiellaceae bacterium]|jgi:putative membrane protein